MSLKNKKLVSLLFVAVALYAFAPLVTSAATPTNATSTPFEPGVAKFNLWNCVWNPFTCAVYGTTYIAATIGTALVSGGAFLTLLALQLNPELLTSPVVRIGYSATLALANLGFVFGIIVIALATILRIQTYGLKQLLWKLVVMAVMVNFGLVIAGAILNFSDGLATFFIEKASFSQATVSAQGVSVRNYSFDFVNNLARAFSPQKLWEKPTPEEAQKSWMERISAKIASGLDTFNCLQYPAVCARVRIAAATTHFVKSVGDFGSFIKSVLNLVFIVIFTYIIAFTFLALAIFLLIRYIYLGVLLIVLPLAWLTWVFPIVQSNWSTWWNKFLRWAFFPPIVIFFLYLALTVTTKRDEYKNVVQQKTSYIGQYTSQLAGSESGVNLGILSGQAADFVETLGDIIIAVGISIGGLFAANAISIKGADVAMKTIKDAGTALGGYVGRKAGRAALRGVSYPARARIGEKTLAERASEFAASRKTGLGRAAAGLLVAPFARGAAQLERAGGAGLFAKREKELGEQTPAYWRAASMRGGVDGALGMKKILESFAATTEDRDRFFASKRRLMLAQGQSKSVYELETAMGMNLEGWTKEQEIKKFRGGLKSEGPLTEEEKKRDAQLQEEAKGLSENFWKGRNAADGAKVNAKLAFDPQSPMTEARMHGLATTLPAAIPRLIPKMSGEQLVTFAPKYQATIDAERETVKRINEKLGNEIGQGKNNEEAIKAVKESEAKERPGGETAAQRVLTGGAEGLRTRVAMAERATNGFRRAMTNLFGSSGYEEQENKEEKT